MGVSFHSEGVPSNNGTRKGFYNMLNAPQPVHRLVVRGPVGWRRGDDANSPGDIKHTSLPPTVA